MTQLVGYAFNTGTRSSIDVDINGTLTGGIGSSPQEGDLIIVFATSSYNTLLTISASGNNSGAFATEVASFRGNDTWDANAAVFRQFAGSTPDTSISVSRGLGNASYGGLAIVLVWRGVDATTPMDVSAVTATGVNASRPDCPSITPVTSGAKILALGAGAQDSTGSAFTVPSGMTSIVSALGDGTKSDIGSFVASFDWESGAYDPAAATGGTTSTSSSWAGITLALRPAAGIVHALEASALDVATAAGALSTQIPITGAALNIASASANLTAGGTNMNASAQGQAGASAVLSTGINMSGQAAAVAVSGGNMLAQVKFNAAAIVQALATAAATNGIKLDAASISAAAANGNLGTLIAMLASAQGNASGSADLTVSAGLSGAAIAAAIANANLTNGIRQAANAQGQAGASGNLTTQTRLNGAAIVTAGAGANLTAGSGLSGAAVSVTLSTDTLTTNIRLNADAIAQAIAGGGLSTTIRLNASALAQALASGTLPGEVVLSAGGFAQAGASASLTTVALQPDPRYIMEMHDDWLMEYPLLLPNEYVPIETMEAA